MKRQHKFRAWDDRANKMLYPTDIFNSASLFYEDDREGAIHLNKILNRDGDRQELELMSFTGIKDKNGKEIYEGDKISYQGRIGIVEFIAGMFVSSWDDQTDDELAYMTINDITIVGNTYEKETH